VDASSLPQKGGVVDAGNWAAGVPVTSCDSYRAQSEEERLIADG
jgi:hypothetical protein